MYPSAAAAAAVDDCCVRTSCLLYSLYYYFTARAPSVSTIGGFCLSLSLSIVPAQSTLRYATQVFFF